MSTEVVNAALQTGKGISDFGMMAITAGFFLVLSALLMVACFRWFMNMVNQLMTSQKEINQDYKDTMRQLLEETCAERAVERAIGKSHARNAAAYKNAKQCILRPFR